MGDSQLPPTAQAQDGAHSGQISHRTVNIPLYIHSLVLVCSRAPVTVWVVKGTQSPRQILETSSRYFGQDAVFK